MGDEVGLNVSLRLCCTIFSHKGRRENTASHFSTLSSLTPETKDPESRELISGEIFHVMTFMVPCKYSSYTVMTKMLPTVGTVSCDGLR